MAIIAEQLEAKHTCQLQCASRGQSADLILVDEVGFVSSKVLLAVLPNIAFRGRKQVHITSHVNNTPWLHRVEDIRGENGEPAYHVVSQSFKCRRHEREPGLTCACLGVYCPQHISIDNHLKELMNMVTPKGFENEVTGNSITSSTETKTDNTTPFESSVINKFLSNNSVTLDYMRCASVVRAYLCLDPTFGGGSRSCAGVCCAVELAGGNLVVMALEELEIRDLDHVTQAYAALLSAHVRLLKLLMPRVMWKEIPVVVVFEQNTYVNALVDVKNLVEYSLARSGFKVLFYSKWSYINNKYMLGKHVGAKTKLAMVLSTVSAINRETLYYCDVVMSLGWAVLSEAMRKTHILESSIGTAQGAGSSNKMGSNKEVFMYRRSQRGVNLATDITASVLETRDVITLPESRLADKTHAQQGKVLLGKLREELSMVTITASPKGSTVTTGGKKSVNGEYSRDDMLSAFLLLCHTRDEIHGRERSIRLGGEVYCN
ncbi:uncharacterized protein LOC116685140 [Etheostoma spectabile]|uniref:uncharacterized protein LOC116685140 n=1 Tax=Etheostoma spectabile TaxID=54343 RepID=UPI0013AF2E2A|nr:uncharacterized protein LOC116685140 [Etheostoma spectabile]